MGKEKKTRRKRKKTKPGITSKSKKKTAVARATIQKGKGRVTVNKRNLEVMQPAQLRTLMKEPLQLSNMESEVDIQVNVKGGGNIAQAIAARTAIAKALIAYTKSDKLKERMLKQDRSLLVDDSRRKEAKKPLGRGARAKKQLSKR